MPRQERPRRSSALMAKDPFTLTVAPDAHGSAAGQLFLDDDATSSFESGVFQLRNFAFNQQDGIAKLSSSLAAGSSNFAAANSVERIRILGVTSVPKKVSLVDAAGVATGIDAVYDPASQVLTLRKPVPVIASDWEVFVQW